MEDASFFREQAERCRRLARDSADPMQQITLETLALDCAAYAAELDNPAGYWFTVGAQTEPEPTAPASSAIQKTLVGMLVLTPGILLLALMR